MNPPDHYERMAEEHLARAEKSASQWGAEQHRETALVYATLANAAAIMHAEANEDWRRSMERT